MHTCSLAKNHAVLICPSHGHEYVRAHRNLQQLAVQLSQDGFAVMRFDYACTGNSSGGCDDVSIEQWKEDVVAAKQHLVSIGDFDKVSVIGIRLGATLATTVDWSGIEAMILWDPVHQGREYVAMLESYHHRALTDLWRYPVIRSGLHGQLFGFSMKEAFRAESVKAGTETIRMRDTCSRYLYSGSTSDGADELPELVTPSLRRRSPLGA